MVKSDSNTVVEFLKDRLREFVRKRNWEKYHNPKDLAESICIEAAELLELFQWRSVSEVEGWKLDEEKKNKISEELADVIIYSINMANALDIDITKAILDKIEKNERKYPVERYFGKAH